MVSNLSELEQCLAGRVADDAITGEIKLPGTYPHGLGVNTAIDRIIVTSTITADLKSPQEVVSVVKASTLEPLSQIKVSLKDSPSGEAPVEVLPAPGGETPVFYVTNMFGATLWALAWNPDSEDFDASQVFDFNTLGAGVLLEMYFNTAGDRLYVTTGVPGQLHIFDMADGRWRRSCSSPYRRARVPTMWASPRTSVTASCRTRF